MKTPRTLALRIAIPVGMVVAVLWIAAAASIAGILRHEIEELFDNEMRDTAQRILPIVLHAKYEGEPEEMPDSAEDFRAMDILVRDYGGKVLFLSHRAALDDFPATTQAGFSNHEGARVYAERARRGDAVIIVRQPLHIRKQASLGIIAMLSLPLLFVVPLAFAGIFWAVRRSLAPVQSLRTEVESRGPDNLAPLSTGGLVNELAPIAQSVNALMQRLHEAFESERTFAANTAHELRTPVAGAIAQAQRLQSETADPQAAERARDIETTLKRLSNLSEKLMQLARAEGARMRTDTPMDLRAVVRIIAGDFARVGADDRIDLQLPDVPAQSDLDPDLFGILTRNLIENALRHGTKGSSAKVTLDPSGVLTVVNDCDPIPEETLARLSNRLVRGDGAGDGSGLGLAIVKVIADRAGGRLDLASPVSENGRGMRVIFDPRSAQG